MEKFISDKRCLILFSWRISWKWTISWKKAILKYGRNNFKVELLEWCETFELTNERERYWIAYYNSTNHNIGYNIAQRGEGGNTWVNQSPEDKKIISDKLHNHAKNRCWVNNGFENKFIKKDEVDLYFANGYKFGKIPLSDDFRKDLNLKIQKTILDLIWITNGKDNIRFNKNSDTMDNYPGFYVGFTSKAKDSKQIKLDIMKRKEKKIPEFFKTSHYCEKCGVLITVYIGSGRFCSKSCASSHPHSQETKNKISEFNKTGICGMKGKHLTKESKLKHSEATKKYYQSHKFIWLTNGVDNIRIDENVAQQYFEEGWRRGICRKNSTPWNKGLTKDADERILKISEKRMSTMMNKYGTLNTYDVKNDEK